jgi:hypothetical protein
MKPLLCIVSIAISAGSSPLIEAAESDGAIMLGNEVVSFDAALPRLSEMLDGSSTQKMEALDRLLYYGDVICDLDVFAKVLKIASAEVEYPICDHMLGLSREEQRAQRKEPLTAAAKAEAESYSMQLSALCVLANCDDEKSRAILEKFAKSASPAKRQMAESIPSIIKFSQQSGRMHAGAKRQSPRREDSAKSNVGPGLSGAVTNATPPKSSDR